jgi:hypothetical protein
MFEGLFLFDIAKPFQKLYFQPALGIQFFIYKRPGNLRFEIAFCKTHLPMP